MRERKMKPLRELNLMDDFLFGVAMENEEFCKGVLELILGTAIGSITVNRTQMEARNVPGCRGIRVDAFIQNEKGTRYDVEVQLKNEGNLPKRSRYYQSLLDSPQLKAGERGFHGLNQSYIIMIMPFDLFGKQRYCYTFENVCLEEPGLHLDDGAVKMFLNTKGTNDGEVHPDLVKFLHYIENSSDQCAEESGSVRIQGLHKAIREIRASEEMGVSYMKSWELEQMLLEEGREVGKDEYARLVQLLIHAERYGDLERTAVDSEYREELIAELLSGGEEKASLRMPV